MIESRKTYKANYWQSFKKTHKRVYGTLTHKQYTEIKSNAELNERSVWQQIWQESCAYRKNEYLPSNEILEETVNLKIQIRKIGTNINQLSHHSNKFKRIIGERQILSLLKQLEQRVEQSIKKHQPR